MPDDVVARWLTSLRSRNYSEQTIQTYLYPVLRFYTWRSMEGRFDTSTVNADELDDFLSTIGHHGPAKTSYAQALRSLFSFAAKRGYFTTDPSADLRPRNRPIPPSESYTREELVALLGTAYEHNPRWGWSLGLCYYTGTRRSEVTGIRDDDIVGDKVAITGKGNKTRWVPLSDKAKECIENLRPWSNGTVMGTKAQTFTMWVHRTGVKAGFPPKRRHAHLLRATCAAHLEEAGVPASVIRDILGHTNLATTNRYLRRRNEDEQRAGLDLL